ncbi:hypothetical protein EJB05_00676, partial [Eragrostis curvula]
MAETGCARCREWQAHYYWEHMDVTKIRFFKLMTGDFGQGHFFQRIPEKFMKNFKGQITKGVDLKAPSSETWHIGVDRNDNEMFFTSGWEDFVKAHELQENDLLLFTCSDSSSFEVMIFESSGCEKVSSLFDSYHTYKHLNDTRQHCEHNTLSDSGNSSMPSRLIGSQHNASTSKKSSAKESESLNNNSYDTKHEATEEEESDDIYYDSKYYYSRSANRLAYEEKKTILSLAPVEADNPAFVTILQKNHRQCRNNSMVSYWFMYCSKLGRNADMTDVLVQTVPSGFAAEHFEARSHDTILCRPNRKEKWLVKYYYTPYNRCFQNVQFFKFVRENKLHEGDICVFELMKGARRVMMTVHVIRKKVDGRFVLVG